ncbi:MAG: hAT transposon family protein, partial [Candidatus Saccharimonadales bacterium]
VQSSQYPTLSCIARDYLAIQGSAVISERAFSSGAQTGTVRRNRLLPNTFEALQLLKAAYRRGDAAAFEETAKHIPTPIEIGESYLCITSIVVH